MIKKYTLLLLLISSAAFAKTLILTDTQGVYQNFEISYLEDQSNSLDIEDLMQKKFTKTTTSNFTLGFQKGAIWFKLEVDNRSDYREFILTLNEHFYENVTLYFKKDGSWEKKSLGVFTHIEDREIKNNKLSLDISPPKDRVSTYYLGISGKFGYFGNISIYEKSHFYYNKQLDVNLIHIFILGVLTIITAFSIFLYINLRENIYIYYSFYAFFNFIYLLNISGLLVYADLQHYMYIMHFSSAFLLGFLILFSREYLETKKYLRFMHTTLKIMAYLFFIIGVLLIYSYQPWNKVINNFAALANTVLIFTAIVVYMRGHVKTKYYIGAMVLYFGFIVLLTSMVAGFLSYSNFTRYGFVVAAGIEVIIFSLLLATRYKATKESNELYLENEVKLRTDDLKSKNRELEALTKERESLLKELHHRVKNNFHIIMGILRFEQKKEGVDAKMIENLKNRISSMALIHEHLFTSSNLEKVDIKGYLKTIVQNITQSYPEIEINTKIDDATILFDHAISLGIVVNEIVTNSIKHSSRSEDFSINIIASKEEDNFFLIIKDSGDGFRESESKSGIGLKLIKQFCDKLPNSNHSFSFEKGTKFTIEFEVKSDEKGT
ncbi:MAG: 7TM diverse intracellular signaling domain-containing protein [Campylobacterales bacterium]